MKSIFQWKNLVILFTCISLTHIPSFAAASSTASKMITTQQAVNALSRESAEAKVLDQLDRTEIQDELQQYGLSSDEVKDRLASLSDQELNQLAQEMDQAKYAGDVGGILVVVVLVLLIIYLAKRI